MEEGGISPKTLNLENNRHLFAGAKNLGKTSENSHTPVYIYIEGDGRAWRKRNDISSDPTPRNPVALKLAVQHSQSYPHDTLIYMARPCQYFLTSCAADDWTFGRYSAKQIHTMQMGLKEFKWARSRPLIFIGYSGGAQMALFLAQNLSESMSTPQTAVFSVAGVLNHQKWTQFHEVTPLYDSLAPPQYQGVQHHFCGEDDTNAACWLARQSSLYVTEVKEADHSAGWIEKWPTLLHKIKTIEGEFKMAPHN